MSDPHHHPLDDLIHDHDHDHDAHAPEPTEEPLDPANQSLADALRASFRVLKLIMFVVVVLFLISGMVRVDNTEVVVKTRFGKLHGEPLEPGLHWAWPYPIEATVRVPTSARTMFVDAFWLRLNEGEKGKNLDELGPRGPGLDPAVDGALLTGDRAIMHMLLQVRYKVTKAKPFVRNVREPEPFIRTIIQQSAVAEAARTTANVIWRTPDQVVLLIAKRAQQKLDALDSGITLDNVAAEKSHYPLQAKNDFLAVQEAENRMRQDIQAANKVWEEKVKGAAGPAWEELRKLIDRLDSADAAQQGELMKKIDDILLNQATGEASGRIQRARAESDRIVAEMVSQATRFEALLQAYRLNPDLVRQRLIQNAVAEVFSKPGVSRWVLPQGTHNIWLNKDPVEIREQETRNMREAAGQPGR